MVSCSFCQCLNDDTATFCKQCNSNLAVTGIPVPADPTLDAIGLPPAPDQPPESALVDDPLPATVRLARIPMVDPRHAPAAEAAQPQKPGNPADQTTVVLPVPPPAPMIEPVLPPPVTTPAPPKIVSLPRGTPVPAPHTTPPRPTAAPAPTWTPENRPKLVVLRGLKVNHLYTIYDGRNFIGRPDDKPVDIDLEDQEPTDRVWASRQHAVIVFENGQLLIEDLNSLNGTFVNRSRVHPGQQRPLQPNDIIQIGTVQMKVTV
jgi:FHA domain